MLEWNISENDSHSNATNLYSEHRAFFRFAFIRFCDVLHERIYAWELKQIGKQTKKRRKNRIAYAWGCVNLYHSDTRYKALKRIYFQCSWVNIFRNIFYLLSKMTWGSDIMKYFLRWKMIADVDFLLPSPTVA